MSQRPSLKLEGTLAVDGKSLREAMRWTGREHAARQRLRPVRAQGADDPRRRQPAVFSGVNIELDGNVAEGVLALTTEPRVDREGHARGRCSSTSRPICRTDRDPARERAQTGAAAPSRSTGFSDLDLDLRLSAARVTVSTAKLGRTAVAANLRDGRLTLAIGEAQAYRRRR